MASLAAPITSSAGDRRDPPAVRGARTPLRRSLLVGALAAIVKLTVAVPFLTRYGWDRDELYFLQASHHLSLGYVDFPMLTALVGRLTIGLAGPSLFALRLTGVLAAMVATALVGLIARELGGGLKAQAVAAVGFVLTPYGLGLGMIFHPTMFDLLTWVAFSYVAVRILRRPEPRLWPWLGVIAGVGLEAKGTILALLVVFAAGLLTVGPREVVRERGMWIAAAIALVFLLPYLGWEAAHGWPSLTFLPSQDAVTAASTPRDAYVAQQLAFLAGGLPLVVAGVRELWRDRRSRALAVLAPATSLLFFLDRGRSYYSLPAIALPLAAGAVAAGRWWPHSRHRSRVLGPVVALTLAGLVLAAPSVWPVVPTATMVKLGVWKASFYKDEIGWSDLVAQTARAWQALPVATRHDTGLLAENYGEAGALALYGPARGLPQPLSGHLSFQYWHPRRMPQRRLLTVGYDQASLRGNCRDIHVVARIENRWGIANEEQGAAIATCTLSRPLGAIWSARVARDRL